MPEAAEARDDDVAWSVGLEWFNLFFDKPPLPRDFFTEPAESVSSPHNTHHHRQTDQNSFQD